MTDPITPPPPPLPPSAPRDRVRTLLLASTVAALLIGFVVGAVVDRTLVRFHDGGRRDRQRFGFLGGPSPHISDRLARELQLTPDQRTRIDSVLARRARDIGQVREQVRPAMRQIFDSMRAEVDSVLTPEQRSRMGDLFPRGRRGGREGPREGGRDGGPGRGDRP